MKRFVVLFFMVVGGVLYCQNVSLTVNVTGFKNNKGKVMVAMYDSEGNFLKKMIFGAVGKIEQQKSKVVFEKIPVGVYAVSLFHDENDNNKLDTNFMGIPKERYASSNDAKGFMGPPKYDDAKFELKKDKVINLKL
ncbi:MAG: DUF2141 domain-containing protein [Flavobacterium sp.]